MIETRPGDLVAGGHFAGGVVLGLGVATAVGIATRRTSPAAHRRAVAAAVVASAVAAGGAYACTPDTELARGVLGAVVGAGTAATVLGIPWWWPSLAVTASLVAVAVLDGATRASAVIGALAIAALHGAAQVRLHRGARPTVVLPVLAGAVAVCSRVAGLAATAGPALLVAGIVLAAAVPGLASAGRNPQPPAPAGGDEHGGNR